VYDWSMTKQHFIALADALRETRPIQTDDSLLHQTEEWQWNQDVQAIASVCARANSRFNRERWLGYIRGECGPNGGSR
jgi:hypothetical protein